MRVLSTLRFTALRMIRNYVVLLLLLVVPIVIISVFYFILSGEINRETGTPYFHETSLTMVLVFQLFGGSIVMYLIHNDLFAVGKMRMHAAPFSKTMYAFSIMMCGTVFSIVLGVILMLYSRFALGMVWEHWMWTVYLIALMSVLSSIVCLIFTFAVKSYKLAERLSEVYGVGFVILAGMFFPMPHNAFFDFMGTYGNPLTLSIGAVLEMNQGNTGSAWLHANILLAATVVLFIVMALLGRRRMA